MLQYIARDAQSVNVATEMHENMMKARIYGEAWPEREPKLSLAMTEAPTKSQDTCVRLDS